ncbi:MAG: farnesyl diphosphate synthase [Pseudomonadota bacterium]
MTQQDTTLLSALQDRVNLQLSQRLDAANLPPKLIEGMQYGLLGPGKRVRPALIYATNTLYGGTRAQADAAACALECIHAYSLIHDDLPALDNDDLRRGRPTVHKQFGEAAAILIGDALLTFAFELLSTAHYARTADMVRILAQAAGYRGMVCGQWRDIFCSYTALSAEQITQLHQEKTGALFAAALQLGALSANQPSSEPLQSLGLALGVWFQIQDDLLDVLGTENTLGKATQKDHALGKNTFPSVFGTPGAQAQAAYYAQHIEKQLNTLGPEATELRSLVNYLCSRTY